MSLPGELWRRLVYLVRRDRMAADLEQEMRLHVALRAEALQRAGVPQAEAPHAALRRFGNRTTMLQESREMWGLIRVDQLAQDLRFAVRGLIRRPAFTGVAVLSLALGIGATTALFSAANVLLFRPLPYARPDQLMKVTLVKPPRGGRPADDQSVWSYPKFLTFRATQRVFSELALYTPDRFRVTSGEVESIGAESVSAAYLRTLGVAPTLGHDFDGALDTQFGVPGVVILSYDYWVRRFSRDSLVVGRTIDLNRTPFTIIGVSAPGFRGLTGQADIFVPITVEPAARLTAQSHSFWLVARRAAGVGTSESAAEVRRLGVVVNDAHPNAWDKANWGATAEPLDNARIAPLVRRSVLVLFGAVALVLLITCANVGNLLLGRAQARRREIALRFAIGASRARVVHLLLTEGLLLAFLGGAGGTLVAWFGVYVLASVNPATTLGVGQGGAVGAIVMSSIALDRVALAFTFGTAVVIGAAFGLVPAIGVVRSSLADALKAGSSEVKRGVGRALAGRRALVIGEVALALVLLAGSGLMIHSLGKLLSVDTGFDGRDVLTFRLSLVGDTVSRESLPPLYTKLLDRIGALSGVTHVSLNNCPPLGGACNSTNVRFLDHRETDIADSPSVGVDWASPTWFATMRVPLRRGRIFTSWDRAGAPQVVVVNEAAVRKFWPNEDPIGKHVELGMGGLKDAEVIGVVGNVRQRADSAASASVYASVYQSPFTDMTVFVRTTGELPSLGAAVRRAIREAAPSSLLSDMRPMSDRAADATARARFSAVLLSLFAITALLLAAIGIYGVMSLAVAARTREIGIRIALGADRGRVQRLIVGEGAVLVAVGGVIGIAGAVAMTRVLQVLLFDLSPFDPGTYAAVVVILAGAAMLAGWIPARRASRVDPQRALRAD
jgi:putative ABC transport system permease protein